uniref:Methyltransferase 6, tRNA N3-cytidine n=1 Tax=Nothoprocta perdicaria TaxID=30464 RepID=A0A8C6ZEG4_NOTPE
MTRTVIIRILSPEEAERLAKGKVLVTDFKQMKLEKEAQKNWDLFYKRNSTNFFKDRHWTTREFQELKACREFEDQKLTILEAGCGVGNCLFPLLEEDLNIFAYACDFSPRAVEYVKKNSLYSPERCKVFQCDLTKDDLTENIPAGSVDVVTLIFVLSAIHPDKMHLVLKNIYKFLFQLFTSEGYEQVANEYVQRETVNRKEGLCVPRVFLQGKFRKPLEKTEVLAD